MCDEEQRAVIKAVDLSNDFLFQLYRVNGLPLLTVLRKVFAPLERSSGFAFLSQLNVSDHKQF